MKRLLSYLALAFIVGVSPAHAQQTEALRQVFHAPKADVEQALKDIQAYQPGRLPFLEGFVGSISSGLHGFQRPSYQFAVTVEQVSESEVSVQVNARISAWYEATKPADSGYRDLPSSGRLEEDLLSRLSERLRQHADEIAASRTPMVSPKLLGTMPQPAGPPITAKPSAHTPAPENDARYDRLLREEKSLNDVLSAQQHPDDLIAVRNPHTAVRAAATSAARVLFYADAEDEFQILKTEGEWVHVKISGLNRGWIQSSQVERIRPDGVTASAAKTSEAFSQTKEESSTFPGDWPPLRGKTVKVIWVKPVGDSTKDSRLHYAKSLLKEQAQHEDLNNLDGVVIVFDSAEGGMAAATTPMLRQWKSGTLTDTTFLAQCWFDPADAFAQPDLFSSRSTPTPK